MLLYMAAMIGPQALARGELLTRAVKCVVATVAMMQLVFSGYREEQIAGFAGTVNKVLAEYRGLRIVVGAHRSDFEDIRRSSWFNPGVSEDVLDHCLEALQSWKDRCKHAVADLYLRLANSILPDNPGRRSATPH